MWKVYKWNGHYIMGDLVSKHSSEDAALKKAAKEIKFTFADKTKKDKETKKLTKKSKEKLIKVYRRKIREAAISRTKAKIALQGKVLKDFTDDQVRDIVAEEERDLTSDLKTKGLLALAAALGFGII